MPRVKSIDFISACILLANFSFLVSSLANKSRCLKYLCFVKGSNSQRHFDDRVLKQRNTRQILANIGNSVFNLGLFQTSHFIICRKHMHLAIFGGHYIRL